MEKEKSIYRYSQAYFNSKYDKTLRFELITDDKNENRAMARLTAYANKTKGFLKWKQTATTQGLEAEEIGINDLGNQIMDKIYKTFN